MTTRKQQLLAQMLAQGNVTTGAASPALRAPTAPTRAAPAARDRGQRMLDVLTVPFEEPRAAQGQIAPVDAQMLTALANIGRGAWVGLRQRNADNQSRELLARELAIRSGQDPDASPLQPIVPPSLQGVKTLEAPKPDMPQTTQLSPEDEKVYRAWLDRIGMTADRGYNMDQNGTGQDYDMRGFFKKYGPADVNVAGGQHFTDEFKLPNHQSFSDESNYAQGAAAPWAGHWNGDQYVPSSAREAADSAGASQAAARDAQRAGLRSFVDAAGATAADEAPRRAERDVAALLDPRASGLAAQRLFPKPAEPFTLKENETRFNEKNEVIARGQSKPEDQWEPYTDAAGNTLQRNKTTGEVKSVITAQKPQGDPEDVRNYEYAKAGGYPGSFTDYQMLMGRSKAARTENPPAPGYRNVYDEQGNLVRQEVIPGSAAELAEQKAQREAADAQHVADAQRSGQLGTADLVTQEIDRVLDALDNGGPTAAGGLAGAKDIPIIGSYTDARKVAGLLDTIKANIGFEQLNKLRQQSKTGGALGNVTETELHFLQSIAGSLDQSGSPEVLRDNLNRLWNAYQDVIHGSGSGPARRSLSYQKRAGAANPAAAPAGVDPAIAQRAASYYEPPAPGRGRPQPQPIPRGDVVIPPVR